VPSFDRLPEVYSRRQWPEGISEKKQPFRVGQLRERAGCRRRFLLGEVQPKRLVGISKERGRPNSSRIGSCGKGGPSAAGATPARGAIVLRCPGKAAQPGRRSRSSVRFCARWSNRPRGGGEKIPQRREGQRSASPPRGPDRQRGQLEANAPRNGSAQARKKRSGRRAPETRQAAWARAEALRRAPLRGTKGPEGEPRRVCAPAAARRRRSRRPGHSGGVNRAPTEKTRPGGASTVSGGQRACGRKARTSGRAHDTFRDARRQRGRRRPAAAASSTSRWGLGVFRARGADLTKLRGAASARGARAMRVLPRRKKAGRGRVEISSTTSRKPV